MIAASEYIHYNRIKPVESVADLNPEEPQHDEKRPVKTHKAE
jgi:hypothetical protein